MQRFTLPRDIYHGYGSMEILKNLTGKVAQGPQHKCSKIFIKSPLVFFFNRHTQMFISSSCRNPTACGSINKP